MKSKSTSTKTHLQGYAGKRLQNLANEGSTYQVRTFTITKTIIFAFALIIANLFFISSAFGQKTWDGGASTNNWGDANNWNPNGVPAVSDAVTLINNTTVNVNVNASCASITFPSTNTSNITLNINSGINLSVTGAITIPRGNNGVNTLAVGSGILSAGSIAFTNGGTSVRHLLTISTGTVTVTGNVVGSVGNASGTISFSGAGLLRLGGTIFDSGDGTLTTFAGSRVEYNAAGAQTTGDFVYSNLTLSGSGVKTLQAGTTVNGILSREGTATASGTFAFGAAATLQYKGTAAQTTGTEFPATFNGTGGVIIDNSSGVTLGAAKTISRLTLTSGILTTSTSNLLSVTNTTTTGISGGSTTSFILGPVRWTLPASLVSGSTYNFPVGKGTTYLPFSLVNPTTGTGSVTAQVEAFTANPGGTLDATLTSKSTSEYWSLVTAGNFANSSVSLTRQTAIAPLDAIGGSATVAGIYTSLAGTAGANGVTGSTAIGSNRFFVLAQKASATTTFTSTGAGGNWNTPATWDLNLVPTATSNVVIATGSPVIVNVNTASIGNLTVNSTLDAGIFTVSGAGTLTVASTGTILIGGEGNFTGFSTPVFNPGSTINYDGAAQTVYDLTYSNLILSGSGTKTLAGATIVNGTLTISSGTTLSTSGSNYALSLGGNFTNNGTFTAGSGTVTFNGSTAQTIGGTASTTFYNLTVNNTSGGVSLGNNETVSGSLTLTSGILATGANLLSITNTSTSGISGGSTTSFINGPVNWSLPTLVSGSTYNFPVGKGTTYLPFSLINPTTTGTSTAQVEAFTASSGGTLDATLVSKSTTEYWSLVTGGNFTNSSVSLARQTAIAPSDAISGSSTLAGLYTSLAGTATTNGVTGSTAIGVNRFFAFARNAAATYTSVFPGGDWNSASTWLPASVPPAGSDVEITAVGPVTVTAATATIANLTIDGLLDAGTYAVTGTGTLYVSSTGTLLVGGNNNFPSGFSTINMNSFSYVHYNGGSQTVSNYTYGNLILSNSGIKTLPASSMSVDGNFTINGTATTTVSNSLTVSGGTTLAGSSILTLGADNVLNNSSSLGLDGGTFRTGTSIGYSETTGVLWVSNISTISLGTGDHTLTFAASNGVTWSGTSLTITGWTGTPGLTGTAGKIFFGSSANSLTAAQLAKVSFNGYPGTNAILLSTGELVPSLYPSLAITGITSHGSSCIGIAATQQTYTITNTGGLANGVTVLSDNTQFVVSGAPTTVAGNGGTATYIVTFTPASSGDQTATITVTSTTPGSNSPTSILTGTGNDYPTVGLSSSDPDNIICTGDAVTFTATGGSLYEFFVDAVSQGTASATATFTASTLTTGQIVTVMVTNTSSCSATSTGINTTVNERPAAPVITGTSTVDVGGTTLLGSPTPGGTWTSSDGTKATVDPSTGEVAGIAAGTTTITYTVANPNGCTNFGTMLVTVSIPNGIEDLQSYNGLTLRNYPNPFPGNTIISYTLPTDGQVTLTIRGLTGQVMKTLINEMELEGEYTLNIEAGDLQSGVYFAILSLKSNGKELIKTIRIVKGK